MRREKSGQGGEVCGEAGIVPRRWLGGALLAATVVRSVAAIAAEPAGASSTASVAAGYRAAVVMEAGTGAILYEKDPHLRWPPASMVKMMLMLIVAERVRDGAASWSDPVVVSRRASQMGGSQVYLKEGETFSLGEMMQAVVIHSANDASVAVAEAIAGSADAFVDLMNERARELGLQDTVYHSVHGLPPGPGEEPDLSSARDLAVLARELVRHPQMLQWARTPEAPFRGGQFRLTNTNRLVRQTNWIDGLKTGYHRAAGFNVAATGERNGLRLIAVVLGAPRKQQCFDEAARLLGREFARYKAVYAVRKGELIASDVPVRNGKPRFVRVIAGEDLKLFSRREEDKNFTLELALPGEIEAPLPAAARIGEIIVKEGEREVGKVPALAADAVERQKSLWERLF